MEELLEDTVLVSCRINGQRVEEEVEATTSLLDFLRTTLQLTGTHMGCMTGHCGACTVLIDGKTAKSCITPVASLRGQKVTTLEGLAVDGKLHPVQLAFRDESGFQCGYCAPGMVLTCVELLAVSPDPGEAEIRQALNGNLCRCTGYQSIVRAARRAAQLQAQASEEDDHG